MAKKNKSKKVVFIHYKSYMGEDFITTKEGELTLLKTLFGKKNKRLCYSDTEGLHKKYISKYGEFDVLPKGKEDITLFERIVMGDAYVSIGVDVQLDIC